jgi:hypothetical protein
VLGLAQRSHVVSRQENPMPQAVNLVLILVLAVAPVYAVVSRSRWSPAEAKSLMVAIPLLLFPLNAPLHEASHIVGTRLAGGTVGQVRLWQPFWKSDAPVAMIETSGLTTPLAEFVASVSPYLVDAALLVAGAALLCRPRIRSAWRFGAYYLLLVLKPSFDIAANVAAASIYGIGDFRQMARIVGQPGTGALEGVLLAAGIVLTLAVTRAYRGQSEEAGGRSRASEVL